MIIDLSLHAPSGAPGEAHPVAPRRRRRLGPAAWWGVALGLSLFVEPGRPANAQKACADCQGADSPCSGLKGKDHAQCVGQCMQSCHSGPPKPAFDPRCSDRAAKGKIQCVISTPPVNQHETPFPAVVFAPGDVVDAYADGCVQTGGHGDTWKRYVNPFGDGTSDKYHGLLRIPTAKPAGSGLVRFKDVIGRRQTVTGTGVPVSQLVLHLGYEDGDYADNGYNDHDDGNNGQCSMAGASWGGPAYVTITIYRGVSPDPPQSHFDFDLLSVPDARSAAMDPNGLLFNPQWSWQLRPENQGQIPSTSLCHEFSERATIAGIPTTTLIPSFADCTDQADLTSVDGPIDLNATLCQWRKGGPFATGSFTGHVNWFPVTVEGTAGWGDHGLDDDYTFTFDSDLHGDPLSVNGRPGLHVEFDSDETIDHFLNKEWKDLRDAVDGDNRALAGRLFNGHTILTGMFGLDGEHDLKAELHPLYALATRRDSLENEPTDEVWLMFVRNRGDEGFCSSALWDAGFEDYTVRLPWRDGKASVDVNWSKSAFDGTDGTSGPTVAFLAPPSAMAGVYVTFHLGPAAGAPFMDGALHLVWAGEAATAARAAKPIRGPGAAARPVIASSPLAPATARPGAVDDSDEVEHAIHAAIQKLTPAQQREVKHARAAAVAAPAVHRLPAGGPVRRLTAPPATARIAPRHAIKAGPATQKGQRDAAELRALCAASHDAPDGLPSSICHPPPPPPAGGHR